MSDPPLEFKDPALYPHRVPFKLVPRKRGDRIHFIQGLLENISARLGIMEQTLRDFMFRMRNKPKNKTYYFSSGYRGLSSIGNVLSDTERLLTQIQESVDYFLEQYPPESESDTGSIDLGSEDTDDTDIDDYIQ